MNIARKNIIKNTIWGNANIFTRYGLSFIATTVIAINYSPSEFGLYQLIITYLGIFEGLSILSPVHLRNHLAEYPKDEDIVVSSWVLQIFSIWVISSVVILYLAFTRDTSFLWLLLLGNVRNIFRVYDYMQFISDHRGRSDLTQKANLLTHGFFNLTRILTAYLSPSVILLTGTSILQGLFSGIFQLKLKSKVRYKFNYSFSLKAFSALAKEGSLLTIVLFLSTFQLRFIFAIIAERMTLPSYGNFQLVIKLIEPAISIGAIVFQANYSVLASTLKSSADIFKNRYMKVGVLTIAISVLAVLAILAFPQSLLVDIFGKSYVEAIECLPLGTSIIFTSTVFLISMQYDMLTKKYLRACIKYLMSFLFYALVIFSIEEINLKQAIICIAIVPIITMIFYQSLEILTTTIKKICRY